MVGATPAPEAITFIMNFFSAIPFAFVALKVAIKFPAPLGVPDISPVDEFNDKGEIDPLTIDHVTPPPVAVSVSEYADPATPENRTYEVIAGALAPAAFTVNVNGLSANPKALVARKVIDPLAVAVGVPDRTPPEEKDIPVGKVPEAMLQVIVGEPVAVKVVVG
jgi:hypothetical protein